MLCIDLSHQGGGAFGFEEGSKEGSVGVGAACHPCSGRNREAGTIRHTQSLQIHAKAHDHDNVTCVMRLALLTRFGGKFCFLVHNCGGQQGSPDISILELHTLGLHARCLFCGESMLFRVKCKIRTIYTRERSWGI